MEKGPSTDSKTTPSVELVELFAELMSKAEDVSVSISSTVEDLSAVEREFASTILLQQSAKHQLLEAEAEKLQQQGRENVLQLQQAMQVHNEALVAQIKELQRQIAAFFAARGVTAAAPVADERIGQILEELRQLRAAKPVTVPAAEGATVEKPKSNWAATITASVACGVLGAVLAHFFWR